MNEQDLLEARYKRYHGETIDVFFHKDLCEHAAKCVGTAPEVFDTKKRPWIEPDKADAEKVEATVKLCPSGALKYQYK